MSNYLAPAVYVEEVSFRAPSIEGVGTTTTGFAGPALTGPVGTTPQLLTSFGDFQSIYGGYDRLSIDGVDAANAKQTNYLALGVKAFFDNGGSMLYVSRVYAGGKTAAAAAGACATTTSSGGGTTLTSRFAGAFANNQTVTLALVATKILNPATLPSGSLVAALTTTPPGPSSQTIGTLKAEADPGATSLTLNAALAAQPATVTIDAETLGVTAMDATKTVLTVSAVTSKHLAGATVATPVAPAPGSTTAAYYTNGATSSFAADGTPAQTLAPGTAPLYALTLRVTAYGAASQKGAAQQIQSFDGLGFDPAHPSYLGTMLGAVPPRHIDALENQIAFALTQKNSALLLDLFGKLADPTAAKSVTLTLANGKDGAEPVAADYDAALKLFEGLEDIAIVAAPGSSAFADSAAIVDSLIVHVSRQRAYRVAILDTPPNQLASDNEDVRSRIDSSYAALYVPWVKTANPLAQSGTAIPAEIAVPPSGFLAGIYARSDGQNGVAKAPANEVVLGALDFERQITFAEQATLNPHGINCLRFFPDRGYRVWGARTVSSNSEFTYLNVRRYLIYLEHSIDNSTQWAVFENNGPALWARVRDSIDSFLNNEYVSGRLLGSSPSDAYFVRCDRTTMTQNDLDNGRMICLIGAALLKPAEFVIFRIGQMTSSARS